MFEKLKDYIFRHYLKRQPQRHATFPDYDNIRSVLILFESDFQERNLTIKAFKEQLSKEEKEVVIWGYVDKKDISSAILPYSRIIGKNDVTIFETVKDDILTDLQRREFDLMIDLTQNHCLPLHYLAMHARAQFKAGLDLMDGIHDFRMHMVPQQTPNFLFDQIIYYLKNIHSNDQA